MSAFFKPSARFRRMNPISSSKSVASRISRRSAAERGTMTSWAASVGAPADIPDRPSQGECRPAASDLLTLSAGRSWTPGSVPVLAIRFRAARSVFLGGYLASRVARPTRIWRSSNSLPVSSTTCWPPGRAWSRSFSPSGSGTWSRIVRRWCSVSLSPTFDFPPSPWSIGRSEGSPAAMASSRYSAIQPSNGERTPGSGASTKYDPVRRPILRAMRSNPLSSVR
jgi:hypothetical protein